MTATCIGLLVKVDGRSPAAARASIRSTLGTHRMERLVPELDWYEVSSDRVPREVGPAFDLASTLSLQPGVIAVEPELKTPQPWTRDEFDEKSSGGEPDLATEGQYSWHLDQVKAKDAWRKYNVRGRGIVIGQLDTGYTEHAELMVGSAVSPHLGYNFEEGRQSPLEPTETIEEGHGAATGSVLVGQPGKQHTIPGLAAYVEGIAPDAEMIPIRVDKNVWWLLSPKNDVQGIRYAVLDRSVDVITMSRGGPSSAALLDAIRLATSRGVIVAAAAANCNAGCGVFAPAKYPECVCVAGSSIDRRPWESSSRGPEVTIGAPANSVYRAKTTAKQQSYRFDVARSSGTSYATPLVAGAAALWLQHHGGRQAVAAQVGGLAGVPIAFKHVLMSSGFEPGVDWDTTEFGPGILDVSNLLAARLPTSVEVRTILRWLPVERWPNNAASAVAGLLRLELEVHMALDPRIAIALSNLDSAATPPTRRRAKRDLHGLLMSAGASRRLLAFLSPDTPVLRRRTSRRRASS
jgi:subtilisin family serine protease